MTECKMTETLHVVWHKKKYNEKIKNKHLYCTQRKKKM